MSRKPGTPKTIRITLSLPEPVLLWFRERAAKQFIAADEYLRGLIIRECCIEQGILTAPSALNVAGHLPSTSISKSTTIQEANSTELKRSSTGSGFKGVYAYGKRWAAVIYQNGVRQRIGVSDTPEGAAALYNQHIDQDVNALTAVDALTVNDGTVHFGTRKGPGKSGFKGVYKRNARWAAVLTIDGKQQWLGIFDTPTEAAQAYDHGCMIRGLSPVNFPTVEVKGSLLDDPIMAKIARGEQPTAAEFATLAATTNKPPPPRSPSAPPPTIVPFRDMRQIPDDAPLTANIPMKRLRRPQLVEVPPDEFPEPVEPFPEPAPEPVDPDPDPLDPNSISSDHVEFVVGSSSDPDKAN